MLSHMLRASRASQTPRPTFTYDQVANANTASMTVPATAQAGDLAILVDTPIGSVMPTLVIPSGWASVYDFSGTATSNARASFSYKVLVSGDLGATITGMTGSVGSRKSILIFRPSIAITSVGGGGGVGEITNLAPASKTITTGSQQAPVIAIGVSYASAAVSPSSATMTILATDTTTRSLLYSVLNSSPTNQTFSATDVGFNNLLAGCYFTAT